MQTFLPYPDFAKSASVLDNRRLGKQRVEAKQIYLALTDPSYGWQNHPAVKMWRGHHFAIAAYGSVVCTQWCQRGFRDSLYMWFVERCEPDYVTYPAWFGDASFHASHRSNLLRKDPVWYGQFGWTEPNNLPYIWPVK